MENVQNNGGKNSGLLITSSQSNLSEKILNLFAETDFSWITKVWEVDEKTTEIEYEKMLRLIESKKFTFVIIEMNSFLNSKLGSTSLIIEAAKTNLVDLLYISTDAVNYESAHSSKNELYDFIVGSEEEIMREMRLWIENMMIQKKLEEEE